VGPGLLGSQPFGLLKAAQRFAGLPSHGVCLREVNALLGLPFERQGVGVNVAGKVERLSGVCEFDGS
jgi:hypothetical protein